MSLSEGPYIIRSRQNNAIVGRNPTEDRSLLPKGVFVYPAGDSSIVPQATWSIKPEGDGTYLLQVFGGYAIEENKALYADIREPPTLTKWKIEHQPQHGDFVYTITLPQSGDGWRVDNTEDWSQLAVGPLAATRSIPPQYLPSGIFTITPLGTD
ncbi:hypothetical protein MD484_g8250, partial [Candolleomyces efflorescens]